MAGVHRQRSQSPRPETSRLERHPSTSGYSPHAHHRQTSIVNGVPHRSHSRSGSYVNSPATSPLSPSNLGQPGDLHLPPSQMMNIASVSNQPQQILMPQIPASPTMTPATPSTVGAVTPRQEPSSNLNAERPGLFPQHSAPQVRQMAAPPRRHHHSHSHQHHHHSKSREEETKTPAEYALQILFTQFVRLAERKVNSCLPPNHPLDKEPDIESICGPGVDPAFDKLIGSLGYIARHKPKPVIDSLMIWRKSKSDAAAMSRQEPGTQRHMLPRRNTEPNGGMDATIKESTLVADRRTTVAIYILCRVLIEVIGQTTLDRVTEDMAKLEGIIFNQLKTADPEVLAGSPLRMANWTLFGQLLGVMSSIDFERVTDRFFVDLEESDKDGTREEARIALVVRGMSYIKLKFYPENVLEESADFMVSLAKFFAKTPGWIVKSAYCEIFSKLLLPVASSAQQELNHPTWHEFVNLLHPKLNEMMLKPRYWHTAFPVMGALLCVSPYETFINCWMPLVESNLPRLRDKDRSMRVPIVQTLARLVWTYLFRCPENLNTMTKKLEEIISILLRKEKKEKSLVTAEQQVVEPCIQLIRFIGFKQQDLCFRTVVFPLLNVDMLSGSHSLKLQDLSPEGMMVGIRAFLAIMTDLEKGEAGQPPFPVTFASSTAEKIPPTSTWLAKIEADKKEGLKTKIDRRSQAVAIDKLGETAREYYDRFCEMLGKIIVLCDSNFGGQVVLDERLAGPKTPQEPKFLFGSRDEVATPGEQSKSFYDLLRVAIEALPRCLPPNIPFHKIVNLLCKGTAHINDKVAAASANALKSIARQYNSQQVIIGFARFIFAFDERYSTISDGGMLGNTHIEGTLRLYIELLEIWLDTIKMKVKRAQDPNTSIGEDLDDRGLGNKSEELDYDSIQQYVEEIESNGLFFLCSQSRVVRHLAIMVLKTITDFDLVLSEVADTTNDGASTKSRSNPSHSRQSSKTAVEKLEEEAAATEEKPKINHRIITLLTDDSLSIMNLNDENLPIAERSRLHRELKDSKAADALIALAQSDNQYDSSLWFRIFPSLIKVCVERCHNTVELCRDLVCGRLVQMHSAICSAAQASPAQPAQEALEITRPVIRTIPTTTPEIMIEQWKLYLIVACSTLTSTDGISEFRPRTPQHTRKPSKNATPLAPVLIERITSARAVFQMVIPLLCVDNQLIREAVVAGLGNINSGLYKTLIESLQPMCLKWGDDKARRPAGGARRNRRQDRLRAEVTHVFQLTSHFLQRKEVYTDTWILRHMVAFIKDMKTFLNDPEVQYDWEHQKLRRYFCGLTEELYEGLRKSGNESMWLPFEGRLSVFILMQDWCGHGPNWQVVKDREERMRRSLINLQKEVQDPGTLNAAMEIEKRDLKITALSAMASLCAGPVIEEEGIMQFNVDGLFRWIESIFATPSDRTHRIGRRALKNILLHNQQTDLLKSSIRLCYICESSSKATQSYFSVICEVLKEVPRYIDIWQVMTLCLFKLGDENADIRLQAAKLLRITEEGEFGVSRVRDFEVSISDKTVAVYKRAQFQLSKTLSMYYGELAVFVFSELTKFFKETEGKAQRDILHALLPWIQHIDLTLEPSGELTPASYMVLANLFEMTVKFSSKIHSEIQAVWQSLATAPYLGNVQVILDFIVNQSLERREQSFVEYGKQIIVFLSETPNGAKLVEALTLYLQPKYMTSVTREPSLVPDCGMYPYCADLKAIVPEAGKQTGFSYGHLAMILMVDLLVGPVPEMAGKLTLLLQVVFVLWDHYVPLVQEQAKEMLIHLIHELVLPILHELSQHEDQLAVLEFIETVRQRDTKTCWAYDEISSSDETGLRVPKSMEHMIASVLEMFSIFPELKAQWGKIALSWATTCPVRHLACRSFQVFRCLLTSIDHVTLADMLARLSNTIADDVTDIRMFAMEILITLHAIVYEMDPDDLIAYPQLFWATVACLNTIHEAEFMEVLSILDLLLDKMDLSDPDKVAIILSAYPPKWVGNFNGLQSLIKKGLRSSISLDRTLRVFDKLLSLPSNELVGTEPRLLFALLANLPRFSHAMDNANANPPAEIIKAAESLQALADTHSHRSLSRVMNLYATQRFRSKKDFVSQTINAIRDCYFPTYEAQTLKFLVSLLSNKLSWMKLSTMEILTILVPFVDLRKPSFVGVGADLISPLLRLLQTDYVSQSLEVLDKMLSLSSAATDRAIMRMSITSTSGAHGRSHSTHSRLTRGREDSSSASDSLFGVPDDSGWSIPSPQVKAGVTRDNVHAVFYTCQDAISGEAHDVQFHVEEFVNYSRTVTGLSEDIREGGFSDTVLRLGDLDEFFAGLGSGDGDSGFGPGLEELREEGEEQEIDMMNNRSESFVTGAWDLAQATQAQIAHGGGYISAGYLQGNGEGRAVMTPTAFTAPRPLYLPYRPSVVGTAQGERKEEGSESGGERS
ncbi:cell morphogenesis N-terminal-domain-containing protein [Pyronema domesticum]|nr:cell morphogenesis N-terminal-domain-containing protein [Pyronema domesticum]